MKWNYRVVETKSFEETSFGIHEVYYDDEGNITNVSIEPVGVVWSDDESGQEILDLFKKALTKPTINLDDIDFQAYSNVE
mgnify:CR=1 FL=1